jgi:hypothetical protein
MKITWKDAAVTVLVAAVVVPYVGFLVRGSMPFIEDPRGMSATGLVLGLIAAAVAGGGAFGHTALGRVTGIAGLVSLGAGVATLVWAESGAVSDALLAVFIGTMAVTWALAMVGDTGLLAGDRRQSLAGHR